jgi:amino acid permease
MALKKSTPTESKPVEFVFGKTNYRLMLISILVVILGFILMIGETDIYDFRKIVLAPIVVLIGFTIGFFAILKKSDRTNN